MSTPPQTGNGLIGGSSDFGAPQPPMDGLPPEMMQLLMLMAQAMAERQGGGPQGPGPGPLQGLFGGSPPPPTMAGPEAAPTPTAPTAGQGLAAPPQPGPGLTGGIGVPEISPGGGFAAFNARRGLG